MENHSNLLNLYKDNTSSSPERTIDVRFINAEYVISGEFHVHNGRGVYDITDTFERLISAIDMQNERIVELEKRVAQLEGNICDETWYVFYINEAKRGINNASPD